MLNIASLGCCGSDRNTTTSGINRAANAVSVNTANSVGTNAERTSVVRRNFWESAAQGGMAEVAISNLALSKSQNEEIRKLAQTMIVDHAKVNAELKELAAKKKIALPTQMGSYQTRLEDLNRSSGEDFDKNYVEIMVDDHENDVELFKNEAGNSTDAELKIFAAKTLPTLQSHLREIREIQSRIQ